jgi:hypothetical protein
MGPSGHFITIPLVLAANFHNDDFLATFFTDRDDTVFLYCVPRVGYGTCIIAANFHDGAAVATFPYLPALMLHFFRWALDHPWVLAADFHNGAVVATFPYLPALMLHFFRWALDHPWVLAANFHDGAVVATFLYLSALNLMLYFFRWALDHPWVLAANFHDGAVVATFPFDYYPPGEISFLNFFVEDTVCCKLNSYCSGQTRGESLTEDDKTVRYI